MSKVFYRLSINLLIKNEMVTDNKNIVAEIEKIYAEYMEKIAELKKEKNQLINEVISKLEENKREELMKKIKI